MSTTAVGPTDVLLDPGPGSPRPAPVPVSGPGPVGADLGQTEEATGVRRRSSWSGNATLYTIATVILSLGNFGYSFVVVHLMGAREFSRFSGAQGLMLVLGSGCMAAIPWAMARFISERDDRRARQEAMHFGLFASLLQGLVFGVVAGFVLWRTAGPAVGVTVAITAFIGSVVAVPIGFLQGVDRIQAITAIRVLEFVVRFACGVVILAFVSRSASAALIGFPIGSAVLIAAGLRLCRDGLPPRAGEQGTIRALVRQSANLGAIQVFLSMLGALDTVAALAAHLGVDRTASYQSAALLGRIPLFLSTAIGLAAYVHVVAARDDAEVKVKMGQAVRLYSLVVIPFVIACVTVPASLVHLIIPSRYGDAADLLRFTAVSGAAVGWIDVVSTAHQARARFGTAIKILGVAAVAQPIVLICAGRMAGIWIFATALVAVSLSGAVVLTYDARAWIAPRLPRRVIVFLGGSFLAAVLAHGTTVVWFALVTLMAGLAAQALRSEISTPIDAPGQDAPAEEPENDMEAETVRPPRVLVLGDSIACGLGVYGESFGKLAAEGIGAEAMLDLSGIAKSVGEVLEDAAEIRAFAPELTIVACGTTESLVHPGPHVQRLIGRLAPTTWNGVAGLEPRPYFSGDWRSRLRQRIASALKVTIKRLTIRLSGGGRRTPVSVFSDDLRRLIELLDSCHSRIIFVGLWRADERLFPYTGDTIAETQSAIEATLSTREDIVLLDMRTRLDFWGDFLRDHLHLNDSGHRIIAAELITQVEIMFGLDDSATVRPAERDSRALAAASTSR